MAWSLEFAPGAERDFATILQHLIQSYIGLGEHPATAASRAVERVRSVRATAERLRRAPGMGEARSDIAAGVRHVALDRAIYWFAVERREKRVVVLAIFLAGEDHRRKFIARMGRRS